MNATKTRDELSNYQVMGLMYAALLATHLVPQISAEREWVWWAWAVALTVQMLLALGMSFRRRG
jgi:hypothetical protein